MLLGRKQLQRWVQLLLYASEPSRGVPTPLMQLAASRGRLMELMATYAPEITGEDLAFTTGIMSLMDTLLKRPMDEILTSLPVSVEMRGALLERAGPLGAMLVLCERLEEGDPARITQAITLLPGLTLECVNQAQAEALRWANSIGE
jgi:EAL and modified HD-GYP domain-containing signal transduction protein